jgi:hypothetical protein
MCVAKVVREHTKQVLNLRLASTEGSRKVRYTDNKFIDLELN